MSFTETVLSKSREAIKKFSLVDDGDRILVGFSGGADSTVLLCVMHSLFPEKVCAFHVNHMLRGGEADADEDFCREFCQIKNIPFSSVRINVAELSVGIGFEEAARNARYGALSEECRRVGAKKIALAHTASDNIETVIFNLSRGASLSGMRGIPPKRPQGEFEVVRPLILCTRKEIEGFASENGLSFCTDKTNSNTDYTRNFIRHKIVPLIKEINPSAETRVAAAGEKLSRDESFISDIAKDFIEKNKITNSCKITELKALHPALRSRVISYMFGTVCSEMLESKHFDSIDELMEDPKKGSRIMMPKDICALISDENLLFVSEKEYKHIREKKVFSQKVFEGISKFDGFSLFLCKIGEEDTTALAALAENSSFQAKAILPESILPELTVRNRESGEKYVFGGMTRTLKKLLSGETERVKKIRPVFCDKNGIVWFPPFRIRDDIYNSLKTTLYVLYYFEY